MLSAVLFMVGCSDPPMPPSDAEMMLFEWDIREADRSKIVTDESGYKEYKRGESGKLRDMKNMNDKFVSYNYINSNKNE